MKRLRQLFLLLAAAYLVWELYWFHQAGYRFVKWHTHIMFYIYVFLIIYGALALFKFANRARARTILLSITLTLIAVEIILMLTGKGDTYSEHIGYGYSSVYDSRYETYYRLHKPNEQYYISRPEFKHLRVCNSLGFPDEEWRVARNEKKRILFLGDSFTEGYGATQDSNYVSILRTITDSSRVELMNAGIAGNDPVVSYVTYRDILRKFKPDIIVQSFSSNDMNTDIAVKGGLERFKNDSTIIFSSRPWWEPIYAMSYVSRLFFNAAGYNELLLKIPFSEKFTNELNEKAKTVFKDYAALAEKENAQLVVVLQPYQEEIFKKNYDYNLQTVTQTINSSRAHVIDLLPYYVNYFKGREDSIPNYYWKNDGHHNAAGYAVMAQAVKQAIDSVLR